MTDAQPEAATGGAEPALPSKDTTMADAAEVFKVNLGQVEKPERVRDPETGRFTTQHGETDELEPDEVEVEGPDEIDPDAETGPDGVVDAEGDDDVEDLEEAEAPDEDQAEAIDMPASWSNEHAEAWDTLPPEVQRVVRDREGQRDAAVNQKFQEAAEIRHQSEAISQVANEARNNLANEMDWVMSLVQIPEPDIALLNTNPQQYHVQKAQADAAEKQMAQLRERRADIQVQQDQAAQHQVQQRYEAIEQKSRERFFETVPDMKDPQKGGNILNELAQYALEQGAPQDIFTDGPVTSLEWEMMWKAREYDRLKSAEAEVASKPKPKQRKPKPAVKPGVSVPRSAKQKQRKNKNMERLTREGSIAAGAAVFKDLVK